MIFKDMMKATKEIIKAAINYFQLSFLTTKLLEIAKVAAFQV